MEIKYFSYQPEREDEVARRYRAFWSLIILSMLVLAGVILPHTALFAGKTANPSLNKGIVGPDTPYIVLGMGCFWGSEKRMQALNGVLDVEAGYAGGNITNPSYVTLHDTEAAIKEGKAVKNHAEVVKVYYDPKQTTLEHVLIQFWENHNPTQPRVTAKAMTLAAIIAVPFSTVPTKNANWRKKPALSIKAI